MSINDKPLALKLADLYTAEAWPGGLSLNQWALSAASELRRLYEVELERDEWRRALTAVMPADFKDWHQNSPAEWPALAAWCLTGARAERDGAEAMLAAVASERDALRAEADEAIRALRALLDDHTGDNAVEVVRTVLRHATPPAAALPPLTEEQIDDAIVSARDAWNAQADEHNQWVDLGSDETFPLIARATERAHGIGQEGDAA